jgi:uncharacterized protein with gpF-like domain
MIDVWYADLKERVSSNSGKRIDSILATTLTFLTNLITQGSTNGDSLETIANSISTGYGLHIFTYRVDLIAKQEILTASNVGARIGAMATNQPDLEHEWMSSHDELVRPTHREADGQRQPIDKPFDVNGSQLLFPTDDSRGAALQEIIHCRCCSLYLTPNSKG